MMSVQDNESMTRVGKGTPAGEMLRRYWWPVHFSELVKDKPMKVRLLGEDFIVFRDGDGRVGCLDLRCCHRLASLEHGRVEAAGIRCCYHGWLFDVEGKCLEQPAEAPEQTFCDKVRQKSYPVAELASLVWVYIGPQPVPTLPMFDVLHRTDGYRSVKAQEMYCNWLQLAEGGIDLPHLPFLHAGVHPAMAMKTPQRYAYEEQPYGFRGTMWVEGMPARYGYAILPSHNRVSTTPRTGLVPSHDMYLRVPVDDTFSYNYQVRFIPTKDGVFKLETKGYDGVKPYVYQHVEDGYWNIASGDQDRAAQESQGPITDRSLENLGPSDRGVALYRRMLRESIEAVKRGEPPIGVSYEPSNGQIIELESTLEKDAYVIADPSLVPAG